MISDPEIILRPEVFPDQYPQLFIPGHHDIAHSAALLIHLDSVLMQYPGLIEKTIPGIHILLFHGPLETVHDLVKPAGLNAILNWQDGSVFRLINMRKEHGL